ncbi:MBG domain-containing protein [Reichenbachiella sp. MSK19-1]|uniref:MBG domain-containing protein n=1 Tax=Reichenbachiella sp. MSK19-1 TaxID=1897631 RepID=UPI000E6B6310|nr:MBG domain-containing protein [Reichenbachiella sp. MSK19-1]RJE72867.1 hypothetical protein BGP76_02645 [Reichenbachiella sp. MSK19-1]
MKKLTLLIMMGLLSLKYSSGQAQCSAPFQNVMENFDVVPDPNDRSVLPDCWSSYYTAPYNGRENGSIQVYNGELAMNSTYGGIAFTPNLNNVDGVISFKAYKGYSGTMTLDMGFYVGSTFHIAQSYTLSSTEQTYTYDFSTYTGTSNSNIAFRHGNGNGSAVNLYIDDIDYRGQCLNPGNPTAIAKDITVSLGYNAPEVVVSAAQINNGSKDDCDITITNFSLDKTTFTCDDLGENTVTLTVVDEGGRTDTDIAIITVEPYVDIAVYTSTGIVLDENGEASYTVEELNHENSSACSAITYSFNQLEFSCADMPYTDVTVTATYDGETKSYTRTLSIKDVTAPVVTAQDISVTLDETTNEVAITADMVDDGSTDVCSSTLTYALSKTQFDCSDVGENVVILTVTDESGNSNTAEATVTVLSTITDETLTSSVTEFCPDGTSSDVTISTGGSEVGVSYYLRNSATGSVVDGPIAGTGNALDFDAGTLSETTTFNVYAEPDEVEDYALEFAQGNQYVAAGEDVDFNYDQGYTMEVWVKSSFNTSYSHALVEYGTSGASDIQIYVQGTTGYLTIVHDRNGSPNTYFQFPQPPTNQWTHIAVTYDGGTAGVKAYYDGVEQTRTNEVNPTGLLPKRAGATLNIGRALTFNNATDSYSGLMDELRLWSVERTSTEISDNMNAALTGAEMGLVSYFDFNQEGSSVLTDLAGDNDGTLTSMDPATDWVNGVFYHEVCGVSMMSEVTVGDGTAPTAIAQDITVQLDANGNAAITAADIDNGSTDNCTAVGDLVMTLDQSEFDCTMSGENTVTLTVTDASGNEATATAVVTIPSLIEDAVVSTETTSVCPGSTATISLASSMEGISYYLRNAADENIAGPIAGDGEALDFETTAINAETTYHVSGQLEASEDNKAVQFGGTSTAAYAEIASSTTMQLSGSFTLEAWINPSTYNNYVPIIETYDASGGYILRLQSNGIPEAYAMYSSSSFSKLVGNTAVPANQWSHLAFVFDEENDNMTLYINGTSIGYLASTIDQRGSGTTIKLGAIGANAQRYGQVTEDEVRIWNGVRTHQELLDNMNTSLSGDEANLVAYYTFNDMTFAASDMVITDQSGNGNDAVIKGVYDAENIIEGADINPSVVCSGDMSTTVTITPEDVTDPEVVTQNITVGLDGNTSVTITTEDIDNGSSDNCSALTFALDVTTFTDAEIGEHTVTLTATDASGNSATATATVTVIDKLTQTITFAAIADQVYGAEPVDLDASVDSGLELTYTVVDGPATISDAGVNLTGVGTVTIEVSQAGDEDYAEAISQQQSFEVSPATLTATADDLEVIYNGSVPELMVTYTGFVNGDDVSDLTTEPTLTTDATGDAGTYVINVTGGEASNYTFTLVAGSLEITPAALTVTADDQQINYGDAIPALTMTYSGFVNGEDESALDTEYALSVDGDGVNAGTYTILVSSSANTLARQSANAKIDKEASEGNYSITTVNGTLTVNKIPLTITANDHALVYGENISEFGMTYSGFINGDSHENLLSLPTASVDGGVNAGTYDIVLAFNTMEELASQSSASKSVVAKADNYEITLVNGTLTIAQKELTVTPDDQTMVFGEELPELTMAYSGFVNADDASMLDTAPVASTTATSSSDIGQYDITAAGASDVNYSFVYVTGQLTIGVATATISITDLDRHANGSAIIPTVTTSPAGLNVILTYDGSSTAPTAEGTYQVVATIDEPNYTGDASATLVINQVLSADDLEQEISFYPVPVMDQVTIVAKQIDKGQVLVYDIQGHQVMNMRLSQGQGQYNVSALQAGLYIFAIIDEESNFIKRQKIIVR